MGITGVVGSYYTTYGGIPSRLHNVALVAQLIDGALIAPGKTFSFNGTTGERTAEKGFRGGAGDHQRRAPDRARRRHLPGLDDRLQRGLRGRAADRRARRTTRSTSRTTRSAATRRSTIRISTSSSRTTRDHWLLLRTFVGAGSLTVNLYGTPQDRRVETTAQPLRVVGAPPVKRVPDPTLAEGQDRGRRVRPAGALDERQPEGLRRRRHGAARGHLVLVLPLGAEGRPRRHEAEARSRSRSRRPSRRSTRPIPARRTTSRTRRRRLPRLSPSDRLDEPGGHARRPARGRVDGRVRGRALGDELARRARPRTRSGSARRAGRRSASRPAAGRRSAPRGDTGRATSVVSASIPCAWIAR